MSEYGPGCAANSSAASVRWWMTLQYRVPILSRSTNLKQCWRARYVACTAPCPAADRLLSAPTSAAARHLAGVIARRVPELSGQGSRDGLQPAQELAVS